jgi:hypothetical protein
MRLVHSALLATCLAIGATSLACGGDAPRMSVVSAHVRAGDTVVVRFDAPPVTSRARGDVWLTLVPEGTSDEFVGERIVIDEGAAEATLPAGDEGAFELRLVDQSPRRLSPVVARIRVDVDRPAVARNEAPAWYW